jgi:uncharacterized protein (DUF2147 family)
MKALVFGAVALLVSALAAQADPVEGVWQTARDDNGNFGHIQIAPCGDRLCGVLIRAYNGAGQQIDSDNVGRRIVWDMVARGDGAYGKGKIWSPDRDKTYNSKMELAGDRLTVSGCVLVICRDGGTWARVK